ncbi:MAG TPA: molybdopterin cofactor-binding domain-containing protein [Anaerolineae bacterium]|nr:molybdopterin cofactor-binding domain-containing protein [Anaerolineae bacterium]
MVEPRAITFLLNGHQQTVRVEPGLTLLHVLRENLDLTGTKQACDCEGECGACTVLLDGQAVRSCLLPIEKIAGRAIVTIEGLGTPEHLHPVQQAFIDCDAVQCGYCTPGMILSAVALLSQEPNPSREQIVGAMDGNLCRCTGYIRIVEAVKAAAAVLRRAVPSPSHPQTEEAAGKRLIGGSQKRVDAIDKVTGIARYAEDIKMPGLLHAALVRSPYPHARVLAVNVDPATHMPGVVSVLMAADIPGRNTLEGYSRDEQLLVPQGDTVRMIGDAVAIVVGESPQIAHAGAAAVQVEYEPLPHTFDAFEAMSPAAYPIYAKGNVLSAYEILHGDMEKAQSDADLCLEARYETPFMEHSALERETVLSYVDEQERITLIAGHQEPHWAQGWTATMLGLPPDQVRVITPPIGGAFGGKQDPWPLMAGALAAYHIRRPIRLTYSRRESFEASPKRHPYRMDYRIAAKSDGTLIGLHLRIVANTGAYDSDGYYIPRYALVAGGGPYRWQAVNARAWSVYTNGPKAGQMRGFGTPQSTFALECTLDELASKLGIDPLELRLRNAIDDQTVTFLGYPPAETVGYRQCLEAIRPHYHTDLAEALDWNQQHTGGEWRRGVGLAGMWYRFGKSGPITCEAHAELGRDGRITLFFGAPDYGQGSTTVMAQLAAEAMGLPRDSLRLVNADTAHTPDSGIQGASRSTYWVGGAVSRAAEALKNQILNTAAEMLDHPPDVLTLTPAAVFAPDGSDLSMEDIAAEMDRIGQARRVRGVFAPQIDPLFSEDTRPEYLPFFVTGAHVAQVEVNVDTGLVRVIRIVAAHDVGRAINPQGVRGQVEGAVLMSLGAALMEQYIPGVSTGFSDYYLPTIRCTPQIDVVLVEVPSRWGPHGAKGLGEAATLPTAPAILNGIHHATGARIRQLPATPERVLAAIRSRGRGYPTPP